MPLGRQACARRIFPVAHFEPLGRQFRRGGNLLETLRCQGRAWRFLAQSDRDGVTPVKGTYALRSCMIR